MIYELNNSGIKETAEFDDDAVKNIFLPLVKCFTELQKRENRRILVFLAAAPGTGKSTLAAFLEYLSGTEEELTKITTIGMDGFHHYQDYLVSHTTMRNGKEIPMVKIKGAPVTFNLEKFLRAVKTVAKGEKCGWPVYDRLLHNPVEDAVQVTGDIVLLEGNYLLLNREGWKELKQYADLTISLTADPAFLRRRLIRRKISTGTSPSEAEHFVDNSDLVNVVTCLEESSEADVQLQVTGDGCFRCIKNLKN